MNYFSIRISVICIVDENKIPEDGYTQDIQVHIIKANDFDEAFSKALEIGRSLEQIYKNGDGNDVVWRFKEVEYIRKLGSSVTGMEISTRLEGYYPKNALRTDAEFHPENSEPITDDGSNT